MIPELKIYLALTIITGLITLGYGFAVFRRPADKRIYYLPAAVIPFVFTVAFALMSQGILLFQEMEPTFPAARIGGYGIMYPLLGGYLGLVGGLSLRKIATLSVTLFLIIVGMIVSVGPPPISAIGPLMILGMVLLFAYLVLGPYNRDTRDLPGERRLLFDKLRNLLVLIWVYYVIASTIGASLMGLLDLFGSVFAGSYLDIMTMVIYGAIVLRSHDAIDQVASDESSPLSRDGPDQPDQSDATIADPTE